MAGEDARVGREGGGGDGGSVGRLLLTYLRARWGRGWSLASLGPNEARLLYDIGFALAGTVAAVAFEVVFAGRSIRTLASSAWLPTAFVAATVALGVYGRFRRASAATKVTALCTAAALAATAAWAAAVPPSIIILWFLITLPPVTTARLLLSLPYSKRRHLSSLVVNRHGPVLIIGGAGYIGSSTVDLLLRRGYQVRVLDRLMYGPDPLQPFVRHPNFELIEGDATDIAKLSQALRNASAVIHLAGLVGDPACAVDPDLTRHVNIVTTRMAKEVAHGLGIHRFIFASSCSVYGFCDEVALEETPVRPVSLYAQTKVDSEEELLSVARDDFFVTILRFATVFGHSLRPRFDLIANLFTAQAMADGQIIVIGPNQWRPFIHVRDLARAILLVLEAEPALVQAQIYNTGDGRLNMTLDQLAGLVQRVVADHRPVRLCVSDNTEDSRSYSVSFEKIRKALGFEAEISIEEGIRELVQHFAAGTYRDFRTPVYSNVATTRQALREFYDSAELSRGHGPLRTG